MLIVQLSYLLNFDTNESSGASVSLFLLLSLTMSIMSLCLSIALFIKHFMTTKINHNQKVKEIIEYEACFFVECKKFQHSHAFMNEALSDELLAAFGRSNDSDLWTNTQDTRLSINVFYIENRIVRSRKIRVFFELTLTCYGANASPQKSQSNTIVSKLTANINDIGVKGSKIQESLLNSFAQRSKIGGILKKVFSIDDLRILRNESKLLTDKQDGKNKHLHGTSTAAHVFTYHDVNSNDEADDSSSVSSDASNHGVLEKLYSKGNAVVNIGQEQTNTIANEA